MVKILGIADIICVLLLWGIYSGSDIPNKIIIAFAVYLLVKAFIFLIDVGSLIDIAAGILLILSLFTTLPPIIFLIAAILLGIKGVMSLFA